MNNRYQLLSVMILIIACYGLYMRFYAAVVPYPDFDRAMVPSMFLQKYYDNLLKEPESAALFAQLRKVYADQIVYLGEPSQGTRIPKLIHQIWLGGPVPKKFDAWRESWKRHHPDWQYILWTDEDVQHMSLQHRDLFEKAKNFGEKADILRYEILYRYGGVYVDIDFGCEKPLDALHEAFDFYVGLVAPDSGPSIANGLFGATQKHPLLKEVLQELPNYADQEDILYRTGPGFFTTVLKDKLQKVPGRNIVLPATYFYPLALTLRWWPLTRWLPTCWWVHPETYGVHYWEGSWRDARRLDVLKKNVFAFVQRFKHAVISLLS